MLSLSKINSKAIYDKLIVMMSINKKLKLIDAMHHSCLFYFMLKDWFIIDSNLICKTINN